MTHILNVSEPLQIKVGDIYYVTWVDGMVFGKIEETDYSVGETLDEVLQRGGKAYSVVCPEGEQGKPPGRSLIIIGKSVFDRAKAVGWDYNQDEEVGRIYLDLAAIETYYE